PLTVQEPTLVEQTRDVRVAEQLRQLYPALHVAREVGLPGHGCGEQFYGDTAVRHGIQRGVHDPCGPGSDARLEPVPAAEGDIPGFRFRIEKARLINGGVGIGHQGCSPVLLSEVLAPWGKDASPRCRLPPHNL